MGGGGIFKAEGEKKSVGRELRDERGHVIGLENRDRAGLRLWTDQFSSLYQIQG